MTRTLQMILVAMCLVEPALVGAASGQRDNDGDRVLFDFKPGFDIGSVARSDAAIRLTRRGHLRIETGHSRPWPGITLTAPEGKWDLSAWQRVAVDVANCDEQAVTVYCRVDNPGADGVNNCVTGSTTVQPGQSETLSVKIFPSPWRLSEPAQIVGMRGYPVHAGKIDTSNVTQLLMFVNKPNADHAFEISNIRAHTVVEQLDASTFFPFIDEFGQYIHKDWPGKTHSLSELKSQIAKEKSDLSAHPGPPGRDKFGGWSAGPKLKATGFFRVQKYNGKWWSVDPEGHLFWSHGIDCVHSSSATPISDREHYFHDLPQQDSPRAQFYGSGSWAPHGYYKDHSPYRTYDFSRANLYRKYGDDFESVFAELTHRRLKDWGLNTIANWSNADIYLMRKTPYVATIHFSARQLEGSQGYWGKFYDVFDPSFRERLREKLRAEQGRTVDDPWCIGHFVHNELSWGDDVSLAVAALVSPTDQPAKKAFVNDLKAKYVTIGKLNGAWGADYQSWEDLLQAQKAPDRKKARDDLTAFYTKTAETYFRTIRDELKRIAPNQLYMGCRFAWVNDRAARAAAKYCDIISYNRYSYSVADHRPPDGIDLPTIIGEFHFGALDRGMFHTGLRETANQHDRAQKYRSYVEGALRNPYIVGTHWFQYKDQATTGRGDGENYQIGFVDICNTPYPEIVRACRQVGYGLYEYRLQAP